MADNLEKGIEPRQPQHPDQYRIRSAAQCIT
jgi:hypothetical protein